MDSHTEDIIERTKERRELLAKKLGETPDQGPRKRRTPLVDDVTQNMPEIQIDHADDDSPKRHCARGKLQEIKPDTPAISSVKSRMNALASQRHQWSAESGEDSDNCPPQARRAYDPPAAEVSSNPPSRKNRLANLAQTINCWEDDLSHPTITKEEPQKPRWKPPTKPTDVSENQENIPRQRDRELSGQRNKGRAPNPPSQAPVMTKYQAPRAPPLPTTTASSDKWSSAQAGKSPRPQEAPSKTTKMVSPAKPVRYEIRQRVDQAPINEQELRRSPTSGEETDEPTKKPVMERRAQWAQKTTASQKSVDPIQQPISARFAKWEERVSQTPTKPVVPRAPAPQTPKQSVLPQKFSSASKATVAPSPSTKFIGEKMCSSETKSKPRERESVDPASKPVSERMAKWQKKVDGDKIQPQEDEPTAYSVTARMSAWEHLSSSNQVSHAKKVEPGNSPAKPPTKTPPCSPATKPNTSAIKPATAKATTNTGEKQTLKPQKSFAESILEKANEIRSPSATMEKPPRSRPPSAPKAKTPQKVTDDPVDEHIPETKKVLSPTNASCAMKTIHQRLMEQTTHSTQSQSMAERMRQERMQELTNIQNRWQNGILKEDSSDTDQHDQAQANKDHSPPKMQRLSDIANSKEAKKDAIRARARADFEGKLASMGFDVSNESHGLASVSFRKSRRNAVAESTSSQESLEGRPHPSSARKPTPPAPKTPQFSLPTKGIERKQNCTEGSLLQIVRKGSNAKSAPPVRSKFDDGFDSDGGESTTSSRPKSQCSIDSDVLDTQDETDPGESAPHYGSTGTLDSLDADSSFERFKGDFEEPLDDADVSLSAFVPASVRRQSVLPNAANEGALDRKSLTSQSSAEDLQPVRQQGGDRYVIHRSVTDVKKLMQNAGNVHSTTSLNSNVSTNSESSVGETYESRRRYYGESEGTETEDDDCREEMGDFLDEAIDDKAPVAAPRKRRSHMMATNNSNSATSETDCPLVYSISMYRSKRYNRDTRPPPRMVIKRSQAPQEVVEEDFDMPATTQFTTQAQRQTIHEKIKELTELANQELSVIKQTSNALNQCCMGNSSFAGSAEQAECNRLLLISSQRRMAYMSEIQRLKDERRVEEGSGGPKGSLTISEIRLPLKREFVTKLGTSADSAVHYFIILIRNGSRIIVTEMLSTHDERMRGSLDFPNHINLNDITGDFEVQLELYGMSIVREVNLKDKKKAKTPKKKKELRPVQSPGGPNAVMTSSFKLIAVLPLSMKMMDKACFNLDKVPYVSPIYGTIYMRLKCTKEANVQERGFLTMFEDVSGLGAWHRRWCVLSANKICFWKYPDEEGKKDPMGFIDLKRCITEKVGVMPRDICARQHTFELVTVRQPRKGEQDTLVSKTYSTMTTLKHMLSADTKEERILWCNKVNRALLNIRTWHADAARPFKPQAAARR